MLDVCVAMVGGGETCLGMGMEGLFNMERSWETEVMVDGLDGRATPR
jgi:hypothetical protein